MQEKYDQLKADIIVQVGSEADDHLFSCGGWTRREPYMDWIERVPLCLRGPRDLEVQLQELRRHTPHH